jgi:alpha-beta hydrolase superfamily lysophospholipase
VTIVNSSGRRLAGELRLAAGPDDRLAVAFAHGRGSMVSQRNHVTAEALRARGISTLLFDFTGQGESEGAPEECTTAQQVDDLASAVAFLRASALAGGRGVGILAVNSTAPAALAVAARRPDVGALALKAGRVREADDVAARVTVPTLLVVGERDTRVLAENDRLLTRLGGPRCLAVIPGGDHLLEDPEPLALASACMAAWFARQLAAPSGTDEEWLAAVPQGLRRSVRCISVDHRLGIVA